MSLVKSLKKQFENLRPNVVKSAKAVELQAASSKKQEEVSLSEPEVFDRGQHGKFVWVPKALRDYIYIGLDINHLFHRDAHDIGNEANLSPIQRRNIKNDYSVPMMKFLGRLNELREEIASEGTDSLIASDVVKLKKLIDILETEDAVISENFLGDGAKPVSVDQLNLLLNRAGTLIIHRNGDTDICFTAKKCEVHLGFFAYVEVTGTVYANMGEGIKASKYSFELPYFGGTMSLSELGLQVADTAPENFERLVVRGKKYVELTSTPTYARCTGVMSRKTWWNITKFKAQGRIMVDVANMRNIDPNYGHYFGHNRHGDRSESVTLTTFTDQQYAAMSPYIYGFSFISKTWGEMRVEDTADIVFREDAYDMLVMDKDTKDLVFALVDNSVAGAKDFIDGKGGGCIFLLAGPPGGGKTLTAEAIAEKLKRPLHMVGVGELGTDVVALERNLRRILDIAASWNAVLLIDECDIFMEARTDHDIERNAMVGVFLRLLEYYEGVLFLTSNRAGNIDEAFYSRISMALHYDPLDSAGRKTVWTNLLRVYGVEDIDVEQLAHYELNGRKIKGVIRIAKALAAAENRKPAVADFTRVIDKENQFRKSGHKSA